MIKTSPNTNTMQRQFKDVNAMLMNIVDSLSRSGNPIVSRVLQDITHVSQTLTTLEQHITDQIVLKQDQLGALMGIGSVINSSLGRKRVLEEVMDSLISLTRAERGFLILRDPVDGKLKPETSRGIDHINLDEEAFKVSGTIIHKVADTGIPILTTNAQNDPRFVAQESVIAFNLRSILCAPLKLKDKVIGVLYVDNRVRTGMFQDSDLNLITAFADQAAVAIHNADLFESLKQTNLQLEAANIELGIAYEATLRGWVRALDVRDKETEGHTQRVTVLTQRLAQQMGVDREMLEHYTRGALLHDIGKMAISDEILRKRGPLTPEERAIMEKHPVYAYEMLSPIEFLRPAIDIPYRHHEKWNGTGYPDGLKGEAIPLAARIFCIIDVWDALTSDRPYREPLPHDKVRQMIKADAGKHFDPRVVETFLNMKDLSV
ncbi:MAG TPA: HD domain-containing phosphohydrolase [Anaerolineales bacterium]|nr:HD domain-containing phosphohydrolase [Anaerolineales bacterium]